MQMIPDNGKTVSEMLTCKIGIVHGKALEDKKSYLPVFLRIEVFDGEIYTDDGAVLEIDEEVFN